MREPYYFSGFWLWALVSVWQTFQIRERIDREQMGKERIETEQ